MPAEKAAPRPPRGELLGFCLSREQVGVKVFRDATDARPALSVGIVPLPNFTLVAFASFIDTLRLAADEGDRSRPRACRWSVLAPDSRPLRASCGTTIIPWETIGAPDRFGHIVVAGGLLPPPGQPMLDRRTAAFLREADRQGIEIIGICTGGFALAEAGLLRPGDRCCVSWYHHADLLERHPGIVPVADRLWIRERRVISCAGGTASADLAASLVQQHIGSAVAQKSLHIMLIDGHRHAGSAQPQPPNTAAVRDVRVRRVMLLMEQNLSTPLRMDELAGAVALSKRQLERLFQGELGVGLQTFGRDLRLSYAVWMMAQERARISDIAAACGFGDAAHFSRVFSRAFAITPSAAQRRGPAALHAMLQSWWRYNVEAIALLAAPATVAPSQVEAANRPSRPADRRPYL